MKQRGFTLIEMFIAVIFICILVTVGLNVAGFANGNSTVSYGINGMTESRCIEGYKFIIGQNSQPRQILDEFGKGVRCETVSKPGGM